MIVGEILLRQTKIQNVQCPMYQINSTPCTYTYYTKSLRFEGEQINNNGAFQTEQATKISEVIVGEFGTFDGSGFVVRLSPYNFSSNFSP